MSPTYEENTLTKETQAKADTETYNNAINSQDKAQCESITDSSLEIRCQDMVSANLALTSKNIDDCTPLSTPDMRDRCKDNIYFSQAEIEKSTTPCLTISDENLRLQCTTAIDERRFADQTASGSVDDTFCESLSGDTKTRCQARIVRISENDLYKDALASKNLADCDLIETDSLKSQCRDGILFERAIKEADANLCDMITDVERANYCKNALTARSEKAEYTRIVSSGDISACETLKTESYRLQCHDLIILSEVRMSQNGELCENLYNTGMLTNCRALIRTE